MKTKKCPYYHDKECGNPDKAHSYRCNEEGQYSGCVSYIFLNEFNKSKEEEKDGKQDS